MRSRSYLDSLLLEQNLCCATHQIVFFLYYISDHKQLTFYITLCLDLRGLRGVGWIYIQRKKMLRVPYRRISG